MSDAKEEIPTLTSLTNSVAWSNQEFHIQTLNSGHGESFAKLLAVHKTTEASKPGMNNQSYKEALVSLPHLGF